MNWDKNGTASFECLFISRSPHVLLFSDDKSTYASMYPYSFVCPQGVGKQFCSAENLLTGTTKIESRNDHGEKTKTRTNYVDDANQDRIISGPQISDDVIDVK